MSATESRSDLSRGTQTPRPFVGRTVTRRAPRVTLESGLVLAYVFLLPVQVPVAGGRVGPSDLCLLLLLLVGFPRFRRVPPAWGGWHLALLGVFAVSLTVAFLRTGDVSPYALVQKTVGLLFLLVGYIALVHHASSADRIRAMLRWFVAGVTANASLAIVVYLGQVTGVVSTNLVNFGNARVSGLLIDPNAFGGVLVVALVVHLWTARTPAAVWTWRGSTAVSLTLFLALILTFSRSAWIAFLAAVLAAVAFRGTRGLRAIPRVLSVAIAAVVVAGLAYLPDLVALALRPNQVTDRLDILSNATSDFVKSPLYGIGVGTFQAEHNSNIVHNTAFWFAAEFGIIGLVVFLGLILWYVIGLARASRQEPEPIRTLAFALLLSQVAMLGLSVGIEAFYQRYWWMLLAVSGALFALCRSSVRNRGDGSAESSHLVAWPGTRQPAAARRAAPTASTNV